MTRMLPKTLLLLLLPAMTPGQTLQWTTPEPLEVPGEKARMTRNPNGVLQHDSFGGLHLVFWTGGEVTSPTEPSRVYHTQRTPSGWTTPEKVDRSVVGGDQVGGRHPSLAIGDDGTLLIVWHDARHSTPGGTWIDNLELYATRRSPLIGTFPISDVRLTETSAAHSGDNAYFARAWIDSDNLATVLWYDFNDDFTNSDIYARQFDVTNPIPSQAGLGGWRVTNRADRGGVPPFIGSDITRAGDGALVGVWTAGFGGAAPLYAATIPEPIGIATGTTTIDTDTDSYFNHPRVVVAPSGDLWAVYTKFVSGVRTLRVARYDATSSTWGAGVPVANPDTIRTEQGHVAFDGEGVAHLVFVDEEDGRHVYHLALDGDTLAPIGTKTRLTASAGSYRHPVVAIGPTGVLTVVWEQEQSSTTGVLQYAEGFVPASAAGWEHYE